MTDYDDLPFTQPTGSDPVPTPRKCSRHDWVRGEQDRPGPDLTVCARCGHRKDLARMRRGKSSRRLGGDQERRIERVYGPTKIGERGDPVDHIGRVWRWQAKATRALPPRWLASINLPTPRDPPSSVADAWNRMSGLYGTRRSVVIRSYVSRGIRTRDWLFVGAEDAVAEFGAVIPYFTGWWVIPGDWWLDHFGSDVDE